MDGKLKLAVIVSILALLLFTGNDKKANSLSGISKRKSRRLFYISDGKVIPRSQVDSARRMARSGYGKVYAVWAFNADEAREYIRQGKAETVSGLGETPQWKYHEYSQWARNYAEELTIPELEKELKFLEKEQVKNTESHLKAIKKSTSMQSNSQHRAQAGNVVTRNYEHRQAIKDAIEIHKYYPEKSKGGQMSIKDRILKAKELGRKAFYEGKKGTPFLDKELTHLYEGLQVGQGIEISKAWTKAWDQANLSQPIPEKRKTLPEQTSFTERSQMTLFGGLGDSGIFYSKKPPFSDKPISAVRLTNGYVYYDDSAKIHLDLINNLGINPEDVEDGGFIVNGKYVEGSANSRGVGVQARARKAIQEKRLKRSQMTPFGNIKPFMYRSRNI